MRQEFDRSVPLLEQRMRVANAKEPGRKHQHRPSNKTMQRRKNAAKQAAHMIAVQLRKYKNRVRAYWLGEADQMPDKPL